MSFGATMAFLVLCVTIIGVIYKTGWRLRD